MFCFIVVQVPTGSLSGLILNDQVEVHHILRPSVRAGGRVVRAHQLDCTVEVVEEKMKLKETLDAIYQVGSAVSLLASPKSYKLTVSVPVSYTHLTLPTIYSV